MDRSLQGLPPITRSKGPHSCICKRERRPWVSRRCHSLDTGMMVSELSEWEGTHQDH